MKNKSRKIHIGLILIIPIILSANIQAQEYIRKDSVKAGDSTAITPNFYGEFKYAYAYVQNTSATLTDSIKFFHIDELGNTTLLKFFKMSSLEDGRMGDSLQSVLVMLPTSNADYYKALVMFDMPYPNKIRAVLTDTDYETARKEWIYWRVPLGNY